MEKNNEHSEMVRITLAIAFITTYLIFVFQLNKSIFSDPLGKLVIMVLSTGGIMVSFLFFMYLFFTAIKYAHWKGDFFTIDTTLKFTKEVINEFEKGLFNQGVKFMGYTFFAFPVTYLISELFTKTKLWFAIPMIVLLVFLFEIFFAKLFRMKNRNKFWINIILTLFVSIFVLSILNTIPAPKTQEVQKGVISSYWLNFCHLIADEKTDWSLSHIGK